MTEILLERRNLVKIGEGLKQFELDSDFLNANRAQWLVEYPDKWVVVFKEELVGIGDNVIEALRASTIEEADRPHVAIEYLDSNPVQLILASEVYD